MTKSSPSSAPKTTPKAEGMHPLGTAQRKKVRTFSATNQEIEMLAALAVYHGFSKSAMITSLVKKEFWRVFPAGTQGVQANQDAWIRNQSV